MTPAVQALIAYVQHTPQCEFAIDHCTPRDIPGRFGWVWWKSVVDGLIWEKPSHVCGLAGFGREGDVCAGCEADAVSRQPICTCGLNKALADLQGESQALIAKLEKLQEALGADSVHCFTAANRQPSRSKARAVWNAQGDAYAHAVTCVCNLVADLQGESPVSPPPP